MTRTYMDWQNYARTAFTKSASQSLPVSHAFNTELKHNIAMLTISPDSLEGIEQIIREIKGTCSNSQHQAYLSQYANFVRESREVITEPFLAIGRRVYDGPAKAKP